MNSIRLRREAGVHRLGRRRERDQAAPESRVDPAALSLAAVAAGVSVLSADGDWDLVDSVLGLVLLPVVVAYHRLPVNAGLWRRRLMKLAFSGVAAQILILVIGWPVQGLLVEPLQLADLEVLQWAASVDTSSGEQPLTPDVAATVLLSLSWFFVTAAIYWADPWLMRSLDRDSPHRAAQQRRQSSLRGGVPQPSVFRETSAVKHPRTGSTVKR